MASTTNCPYCGGTVRSDEANCPHCGAGNDYFFPDTEAAPSQRPVTIAELEDYCAQRGMPLQRMRFFIGEDYRLPKAFGIYRDGTDFVVYKNKADGSRSVRYRGPDEARAVGELYDKLRSECLSRGIDPDKPRPGSSSSHEPTPIDISQLSSEGESEYRGRQKSRGGAWGKIIGIVLAVLLLSGLFRSCGSFSLGNLPFSFGSSSDSGYYSGDTWESEDGGTWFWGGSSDSGWSWDDDSDDSGWDWGDSDWDWDDSDTDWDSDW